jgi:hypothetical protein
MKHQDDYHPPPSSSTSYIPNKRPREMSSEYPPPPLSSALPESDNGQRRTSVNRDHRYRLTSSMPGHEARPVELGLNAGGRFVDPVYEREDADSKRRKLLDRAQEEKAVRVDPVGTGSVSFARRITDLNASCRPSSPLPSLSYHMLGSPLPQTVILKSALDRKADIVAARRLMNDDPRTPLFLSPSSAEEARYSLESFLSQWINR